MKALIVLLTIIFSCTGLTFGNTDFTYWQRFKNIYAEQGFTTNTTSICSREKFYIFLSLLTDLSKKVCNDSIYIHVRFGDDFIYNLDGTDYNAAYAVGYCNYDFPLTFEECPAYLKPHKTSRVALNLICRNGDPNISDCLALIYYALTNKENICQTQGIKRANNWHGEKIIPSISSNTINHILSNKQSEILPFVSKKSFNLWPIIDVPIGYYYQNDRYYLYKKLPNTNPKLWVDTTGPVLFDVDNICQINRIDTFNYLIQTNDTTFYYFMLDKHQAEGPFPYPRIHKWNIDGFNAHKLNNSQYILVYKSLAGLSARFSFDIKTKKLEMLTRSNSRPPWSWWYVRGSYE